jgi:hypothetical protein
MPYKARHGPLGRVVTDPSLNLLNLCGVVPHVPILISAIILDGLVWSTLAMSCNPHVDVLPLCRHRRISSSSCIVIVMVIGATTAQPSMFLLSPTDIAPS